MLTRRSIERLYVHQTRALAALERGRDVVLATATASGKTLVYALSTLRAALADPRARALYLFPLKALSQHQRRGLEADTFALGRPDLRVAVYDGDTPEHALAHGHLRFRTRDGHLVRLPARWQVAGLIEAACAARGRHDDPRPRRLRSSSSKSIRAVTGSAAAIVTATRSPSS